MKNTATTPAQITVHTVTAVSFVGFVFFGVCVHAKATDFTVAACATFGTIFYHFAMRLAVGAGVRLHKKPWNYRSGWFCEKGFEPAFYKALQVKKWKKKMPTYFPQSFNVHNHTPEEIVQTMCGSEVTHELIILLSFIPLLFCLFFEDPKANLPVFLITSLLAAATDSIFVVLQRYNRPRVLQWMQRRKQKSNQ